MRAVVGGVIGGVIGAAIWAVVALVTGYELGWIAWGTGALVGFGVAAGNRDKTRAPRVAGGIAVAIAAVSIIAGKYAGVRMTVPSDEEILSMFAESFDKQEFVVSYVADDVAADMEREGRTLAWPAGVDREHAARATDYPPEVWAEATARWSAMTAGQRTEFTQARASESRAEVEASLPEIRAAMVGGGFLGSFSAMDLIFFGLAMTTAYGLAGGRKKSVEELTAEFAEAVQLAMIEVMIADGEIDAEEVRTVAQIYRRMTGAEISEDVVRSKASVARTTGKDLNAALAELVPHLNDEGKATVLRAAVEVAVADGELDAREQALLQEIAGALGMGDDQVRTAVAGLMPATEPRP